MYANYFIKSTEIIPIENHALIIRDIVLTTETMRILKSLLRVHNTRVIKKKLVNSVPIMRVHPRSSHFRIDFSKQIKNSIKNLKNTSNMCMIRVLSIHV